MKSISYSAPAKVILSGEHAVVYGKPGIISAIDKRLTVTLTQDHTFPTDPLIQKITKTVQQFLDAKKISYNQKPFTYKIVSTIPMGRGLGSSAALSSAWSGALLEWHTGYEWTREEVNNCAYQIEKLFHGNPSGADVSTSVFGGLVYFRKEFEFLKTISSLTLKIPRAINEHLFLIDTGKPQETTGQMVALVGKRYNEHPRTIENILNAMEKVTKRLVVSLAKEDVVLFQDTLRDNQDLLCKMGVVSQKAQEIVSDLRTFGTGKITGAGGARAGAGFILFFANHQAKLHEYCAKHKWDIMKFQPSEIGLHKEI